MNYQIVFEENLTYRFAADELQKYMGKICGKFPFKGNTAVSDKICIYLGSPSWMKEMAGLPEKMDELKYDGFVLSVKEDCIRITGNEKRSVVYGVYQLLKSIGCLWVCPGPEGEYLPELTEITFPIGESTVNPMFEWRSLQNDGGGFIDDQFVRDYEEIVDWGCKNGVNMLYMNTLYGVPNPDNLYVKQMFDPMICKRDMMWDFGGHTTRLFVDRGKFAEKPEMFRMKDGERRSDGNFCSSNEDALQMLYDGVKGCLDKNYPIGLVSIYFDDVFEGSWCDCPKCKNLNAAEQAYQASNAIAKNLEKNFPNIKSSFLLYHDTVEMATPQDPPSKNLVGQYAPRERCYAHSLDDPSCEINRRYWANLKKATKLLPDVMVYEYYDDEILWNKIASDIPDIVLKDMRAYYEAGIRRFCMLSFHRFSTFAYKLNMWSYANGIWNLNADPDQILKELCRVVYRDQADAAYEIYQLRLKASKLWLQFCGYQKLSDIRDIPPQNEPFMKKHLADMEESIRLWKECIVLLRKAEEKTADKKLILQFESDIYCMELSILQVECTIIQMSARLERAYHGMDVDTFAKAMDRCVELTEQARAFMLSLPQSMLGVDQSDRLIHHLCDDQSGMYRALKKEALSNQSADSELHIVR